jgi:hypothetical protein
MGVPLLFGVVALVPHGAAVTVLGAALLVARVWVARRAGDGGDLLWIVGPEQVDIRSAFGRHEIRFADARRSFFERGFLPGQVSLTLEGEMGESAPHARIWLSEREVDARAVHALLKARLAAAHGTRTT